MDQLQAEDLQELSFEEILKVRKELEQYVDLIDEYVITSKTDLNGIITYSSKAFEKISGYLQNELIGQSHNIIRHPDMSNETFDNLWDTITKEKTWSGEIKNLKKDGGYYWVNTKVSPTYDHNGNHIGYTSVRQDITDKKKIEEVALTDTLTTLYNRRYFNQVIHYEINRANRDEKVFTFLFLDIDYFKQFNDNYGHKRGDEVLQKIGSYLQSFFKRATDIAFRLGGEEFCVIFSTDTIEQSEMLSEQLLESIENLQIEHKFSSSSKVVTVSIGLAICDFKQNNHMQVSSEEFYLTADKALYNAKESGRNKVCKVVFE